MLIRSIPLFNVCLSTPARLALVFASLTSLSGCSKDAPVRPDAATSPTVLPVLHTEVVDVQPLNWPTLVRVQGSLIADEVAVIGSKVAGRVEGVIVDLGDEVRTNSTLVKIEKDDFQLRVAQAAAALAQARAAVGLHPEAPVESLDPRSSPPVREQKASWEETRTRRTRIEQLYEKKAVTDNDLEQAVAAEQVAEARHAAALNSVNEKIAVIGVRTVEYSVARQDLADTQVLAPFDGLIQQRHVAPGTYVQVGQPLITVVRSSPLRFRGMVPERFAQQIAVGQTVNLQIESIPGLREVRISRISPTLDPLSRALTFEADVDNSDGSLRTGLFVQAQVVLNRDAESLAVPTSAIVEFAGTQKVWKLVDGIAREQTIMSGERRDGQVVVLDGLSPGDQILLDGTEGRIAEIQIKGREEKPAADVPVAKKQTLAEPPASPTSVDPRPKASVSKSAAGS